MRRSTRTLCFSAAALLVLVAGTGLADDADTAKLRQAAERGNPVAQLRLAWLIDPGLTTLSAGPPAPEDVDPEAYVEAAKWYRLAAEQGEPGAQRALGSLYLAATVLRRTSASQRDGTTVLPCRGTVWPSSASPSCMNPPALCRTPPQRRGGTGAQPNRGSESAQLRLGQLYRDGKGVPQDYVAAYQWIHLAAIHDCDGTEYSPAPGLTILCMARPERDRLERLMTGEQIGEARRAARDWHETYQRSPGAWYTANRDAPVWRSEVACRPATEVASADS